MLNRFIALVMGLAGLLALVGCHTEVPSAVPEEILSAVFKTYAEAGVDAQQVRQSKDLFKPVELTSQAAPDWVVNYAALPVGQLCGTGGCPLQVWVKIGQAPYALAFDHLVLGYSFGQHANSRAWLATELHGVHCGGTGAESCHYNFAWHGNAADAEGHFAAASIWGDPPSYTGPLVQATALNAQKNTPMASALNDYAQACASAGGQADLSLALVRLPDLNGNGQEEILFDAAEASCLHEDEPIAPSCAGESCQSKLFSQGAHKNWELVWTGKPFSYVVDFSVTPTRLLIQDPDCEQDCATHALQWDDGQA